MSIDADMAQHWDDAYSLGDDTRSWFQAKPELSLRMLDRAGVVAADSVIDVGGGASKLVDALVFRGFGDITVLDISATGMAIARARLGSAAARVQWVVADVLTWQAHGRYQVWHDRAVFHFLTTEHVREQYVRALDAATLPHAVAVFGCFAADGPQQCSGLPTARYDPEHLAAALGNEWMLLADAREEHVTPSGAVQPLTWAAFRRR